MAKGEITHIEFPADDPERAKRFYAAVAGWEFGEMGAFPDYWLFRTSEQAGGAIGLRGRSVASAIRVYITVDSLEDAVASAEANGGSVVVPPTDIGGGMGRYAAVLDPEGSEIGLWQGTSQG
jgi:predicted enzyme related to lactoylglutathione lyase